MVFLPPVQSIFYRIRAFIQSMVGSTGDHIKPCIYQGISKLRRGAEGRIAGNILTILHKNCFLGYQSQVCCLYIFFYILVNRIIIPGAIFSHPHLTYSLVGNIISYCQQFYRIFFLFFFKGQSFLFCFFFCSLRLCPL